MLGYQFTEINIVQHRQIRGAGVPICWQDQTKLQLGVPDFPCERNTSLPGSVYHLH
ncbi:hypothetical protein ACNKHL_17905 [Shigella flexneri]